MPLRVFVLCAFLLFVAGCGESSPTTAPAPSGEKLAPEAELDPVTATEKYQKNKKKK
jgi:hypothetical protein